MSARHGGRVLDDRQADAAFEVGELKVRTGNERRVPVVRLEIAIRHLAQYRRANRFKHVITGRRHQRQIVNQIEHKLTNNIGRRYNAVLLGYEEYILSTVEVEMACQHSYDIVHIRR